MERFFIDTPSPDRDAERTGIEWLVHEARRLELPCAVLMPSVDSIPNLAGAIGREAADFAKKNRHFTLDGVRVGVFTDRTLPGLFTGALLVPWANDAMIGAVEECRPAAICATAGEGQLVNWQRAHDPVDLRTGEPSGAKPVQLTPLVTQALVSLSATINHATGIHHPSDARQARRLLKALYLTGEPLDETEIRTWAIANGWQPRHAADLAELAGKIAAGNRVKGAAINKTEAKDIIQRLREAIE